jgi:very-short-patch-repair endonuclease
MDYRIAQSFAEAAWKLAARQHGPVARRQLLALGVHPQAIKHRLKTGRLHPTRYRGIYAVGRPALTREGEWMAAVLACGEEAALSHDSAGTLLEVRYDAPGPIHVSVPKASAPRRPGIVVHRRSDLGQCITRCHDIPVTDPTCTLVDLAVTLHPRALEAAVNEADKADLIDPETLRSAIERYRGQPGVARLRRLLDRQAFRLTDSELERRFLPIARRAGLPPPRTQEWLHGFRVDFHWPELRLVVETDGLRYHRTAAQQARDRLRDQRLTAAGLTVLRFTHAQVRYEAPYVIRTLADVARRLARGE